MMTLLDELDARRIEVGPVYRDLIADSAAALDRAGIRKGVRRVGERAPDFALTEPEGRIVGLSELLRAGPVVVSFFRGEWCRFCRAELQALLDAQPDMARKGASLLLISPERPSAGLVQSVAKLHGNVHVLEDGMLGVALQYGLVYMVPEPLRDYYLNHDFDFTFALKRQSWLLPHPADFVIGPDGTIALSYVDPDFTRRLDPTLIIEMLETLEERR